MIKFSISSKSLPPQRLDQIQMIPNIPKPYENNYTKTYEGSTWRGAQEGSLNGSVERYGQKQPAPRFQGNSNPQYNGHQTEIVQNGADGVKQVRQPRPNNYQNHQNRQNGAYVPRNQQHNTNPAGAGGHQAPYGVNPNPNGYQGNRGKPEVSQHFEHVRNQIKSFIN